MAAVEPSDYGAAWYADTMVPAPRRGALVQDADVDVCVIGGGLAGLTAAREIARRGWSVVLVEAKRIAWGASGRNAGFVAPGFSENIASIVERVGPRRAEELWALSQSGVEYVRNTIRETAMPGVAPVAGRLIVQRIDRAEDCLREAETLRENFRAEVETWPTERVREALRSPRYFQALHFPAAFQIHPLNYALGLAAAAEQAGARIFESTSAIDIDTAGVRKRVDTPQARVRAGQIVLAGGPDHGPAFRLVADTLLPVSSYIAVTAPLGERLHEAVRYPGGVSDRRRSGDYYRIVDGGRLLWGGRISANASAPRQPGRLIARDIRAVFPQLGDVDIEHAWAGVMSYSVHKMPLIGEVVPGVWLANAFGGHGINTASIAGDLIARAIIEGDDRWRLFSSYELVWAGGAWGRAAAQAIFSAGRIFDAAEERLAPGLQEARRQAADLAAAWKAQRKWAREAAQRRMREAARRAAEAGAKRQATQAAAEFAAPQPAPDPAERSRGPVSEAVAAEHVELLRATTTRPVRKAARASKRKPRAHVDPT
jgi:gamma-glutamylputrescine oxidase